MQLLFSIKPTKLTVMGIISPLIDLHIKLLIRLLITAKNRVIFLKLSWRWIRKKDQEMSEE